MMKVSLETFPFKVLMWILHLLKAGCGCGRYGIFHLKIAAGLLYRLSNIRRARPCKPHTLLASP